MSARVMGALRGYRNGYEPKKVHLCEGTIELQVPQIRDGLEPFESAWLEAIGRRSKRLLELVPMLYVKGMSQRDIETALIESLGVEQTGRSVVNEVCQSLRMDFAKWQERDLSGERVLYLFLDGIYMRLRPEDKRAVAVLCAYGMLWDGRKVLLHMAVGDKESSACWEAFLEDMKSRGLADPVLSVMDGNSGLRKAVGRKFSEQPGAALPGAQDAQHRQQASRGSPSHPQKAHSQSLYGEGIPRGCRTGSRHHRGIQGELSSRHEVPGA